MENIDQSLDSNQDHCKPTVSQPTGRAALYHLATLISVRDKFEHIFIHPTLAFFIQSILDYLLLATISCVLYFDKQLSLYTLT